LSLDKVEEKGLLLIAPFFRPSVGGAETYAEELSEYIRRRKRKVYILAYQPLVVSGIRGKAFESDEFIEIRRFSWFGYNLFHKLANYKILLFIYITPYLLVRTLLWMFINGDKVDTVDAQGLNAAFINKIIKFLFKKRTVSTILALYNFTPNTLFSRVVKWVLDGSDVVLVEKGKSRLELASIGVPNTKMVEFNQWVDEDQFKVVPKLEAKSYLGWSDKFTVLFVGRAIPEKGADILLNAAYKVNPEINIIFITNNTGPIADSIINAQKKHSNIKFVGEVDYRKLHSYYQASDVFCIPSKYEEGVTRVAAEAISCGTPIISSNLGSLPYVLDKRVAILVEPTVDNFVRELNYLFDNHEILNKMTNNCEEFAKENFSQDNLNIITSSYIPNKGDNK